MSIRPSASKSSSKNMHRRDRYRFAGSAGRHSVQRIRTLTEHFKDHKKDFHSRRGLLIMVGQAAPARLPQGARMSLATSS